MTDQSTPKCFDIDLQALMDGLQRTNRDGVMFTPEVAGMIAEAAHAAFKEGLVDASDLSLNPAFSSSFEANLEYMAQVTSSMYGDLEKRNRQELDAALDEWRKTLLSRWPVNNNPKKDTPAND